MYDECVVNMWMCCWQETINRLFTNDLISDSEFVILKLMHTDYSHIAAGHIYIIKCVLWIGYVTHTVNNKKWFFFPCHRDGNKEMQELKRTRCWINIYTTHLGLLTSSKKGNTKMWRYMWVRKSLAKPVTWQNISSCSVLPPEIVMHDALMLFCHFCERLPIYASSCMTISGGNRTHCNRFWRAGCSWLEYIDIRLVYNWIITI